MKATEETEVIAHFIHTSSEDNVTCRGEIIFTKIFNIQT